MARTILWDRLFFFGVLPTIVFMSSLIAGLYYLRVLPWFVRKIAYFIAIALGTSASESLSAAGNIFVGQTEAPLLVKPYMPQMTRSEIHAIMTGGFATIAGSVFGVYMSLVDDPTSILCASVMSAPAALAVSKIAYPETEDSPTSFDKKGAFVVPVQEGEDAPTNVIDALATGAVIGTQLMLNIAGNLIAFLAIFGMLDWCLMYLGERIGIVLSFIVIFEKIFYPCAWLMGVESHSDCLIVAQLIGTKIFVNEFYSYELLAFTYRDQLTPRSFYIASYALCGFLNFGSIGIQLGGLTPMAPNQAKNLSSLVVSAMIAGNTACFITGCVAGLFYEVEG